MELKRMKSIDLPHNCSLIFKAQGLLVVAVSWKPLGAKYFLILRSEEILGLQKIWGRPKMFQGITIPLWMKVADWIIKERLTLHWKVSKEWLIINLRARMAQGVLFVMQSYCWVIKTLTLQTSIRIIRTRTLKCEH